MKNLIFTNKFNAHQGDVQIHSVQEVLEGFKEIEKTFFAKSEKSGHVHALCGDYTLYENKEGQKIIVVGTDGATLNHTGYSNLTPQYWDVNKALPVADHNPTILPLGIYHIGIQRRVNPFKAVWEKVRD